MLVPCWQHMMHLHQHAGPNCCLYMRICYAHQLLVQLTTLLPLPLNLSPGLLSLLSLLSPGLLSLLPALPCTLLTRPIVGRLRQSLRLGLSLRVLLPLLLMMCYPLPIHLWQEITQGQQSKEYH